VSLIYWTSLDECLDEYKSRVGVVQFEPLPTSYKSSLQIVSLQIVSRDFDNVPMRRH
jgi:hypothetical protein